MRVVLDVNVHVSALLSRDGAPGEVLRAWRDARFELLVSDLLLEELARTLGYPKLRRRITAEGGAAVVTMLRETATMCADRPVDPRFRSDDPGDDYLVGLAAAERALLASGDAHVLALQARLVPAYPPRAFLDLLNDV